MTGAAALFLSVFARTALLPVVEIKPAGAEQRRGEERDEMSASASPNLEERESQLTPTSAQHLDSNM